MLKVSYGKLTLNLTIIYGLLLPFIKHKIWFLSINVIGRIFRWIKYSTYMEFILPVHAKPTLFLNTNMLAYFLKNGKIFYIFNTQTDYKIILSLLFRIKKPSIFNKRGFNIFNRFYYKKKGKVTSYITNK